MKTIATLTLISLGDEGALLVTAEEEERFAAIDVPPASAVGTELVRRQDFERLLQAMEDGDGRK